MSALKETLVIGASLKPERYSNMAIQSLVSHGHNVKAIGLREGEVATVGIQIGKPKLDNIHTVTLYLNPSRQEEYYDYILHEIKPERIIFNPGTENKTFQQLAVDSGIEVLAACTLVLLSTEQY